MAEHTLSRRTFLAVAAGLGASVAALGACEIGGASTILLAPTATPNPSPAAPGPYQVGEVILGEGGLATRALPQFLSSIGDPFEHNFDFQDRQCPGGATVGPRLQENIPAAVYYPTALAPTANVNKRNALIPTFPISTPKPLGIATGPFPLLLYAHAFRDPQFNACMGPHTANKDYTSVDVMLRHVASYGCVAVAPDLSWLPGAFFEQEPDYYSIGIVLRAQVLMRYYDYLMSLNSELFAQQLDLSRLVIVGHSTGGPAAVEAGRLLRYTVSFRSLSFGLIAPIPGVLYGAHSNLLVLKGGQDGAHIGNGPDTQFNAGGPPKTLVTIPGANHFGYTDLCTADDVCVSLDQPGTITHAAQQLAGASYLAALVRYYARGDPTARPYLSGDKLVEGLEAVPSIQVQAQGFDRSTSSGP